MKRGADFEVVPGIERECLTIQGVGNGVTITNDVENVVRRLYAAGLLQHGQPLMYYDTDGKLDQIVHAHGEFVRFSPGPLHR